MKLKNKKTSPGGQDQKKGIRIENFVQAWLTDVISRTADHEINRVSQLLPWQYAQIS